MENEKSKIEDDETEVISMVDILAEEKQLEEDANAVLGASDDKNCTYPLGYVPRQALYSCLTCCPRGEEQHAGVCLACCLECHEGHEMIELYTKRNFKCDCGNSAFKGRKCRLFPKNDTNDENRYNQNFSGLYCTCVRPYPDPEDDMDDEMLQCIVCEDWFHGRHLKTDLPSVDFDEMICPLCMKANSFLWHYYVKSSVTRVESCENNADVSIEHDKTVPDSSVGSPNKVNSSSPQKKTENSPAHSSSSPKSIDKSPTNKTLTDCYLKELQKTKVTAGEGATFWQNGWRSKLCRCHDCLKLYEQNDIEFIKEENDTIHFYEEKGKMEGTPKSQYDKGLEALSQMGRLQQVEVLHGFNEMKSELQDYLKKFAENGKVVREEDIKDFFGQMEARKRRKVGTQMSYYCK